MYGKSKGWERASTSCYSFVKLLLVMCADCMDNLLEGEVGLYSPEDPERLIVLELAGWSGGVGAWVGNASWMRESHYAAVEVDYTCGPINGDPKSCPKRVHLVDIIHVDWGIRAVELVGLA